jgi:hypothetical protein
VAVDRILSHMINSATIRIEVIAAVVTALASGALAIASIIALAITRSQLRVANVQRADSISMERTRVTLDYVEDFRRGKYQISTKTIGQVLEVTPAYAISVCENIMLDEAFVSQIIAAKGDSEVKDLFLQIASVAYNFCQQTAVLIWRRKLDEQLLLDLLHRPILDAAEALGKLSETQSQLKAGLDTIPFRLLVTLAKKSAGGP